MLDEAKRTLKWRIRPLLYGLLDNSKEFLSEEALLAQKIIERQALGIGQLSKSFAVGMGCAFFAVLSLLAALTALILRLFPELDLAVVLGGVGIFAATISWVFYRKAAKDISKSAAYLERYARHLREMH